MTASPGIDDEHIDWDREAEQENLRDDGTYQSPLLQRVKGARLTPELLRREIPKVQAGEEAAAALRKATSRMGDKRRAALAATIQEGQDAKQRLFEAALPLIRTVAKREWLRRRQWGSQATLEDLTQEATVGFLKGMSSFNTDAIGRSATNYLGQWMLVETRRSAEAMDHDLQVGHDAGERFRRIRALRARLLHELGREPTDDEIAAASRNPDFVTRPGLVGRAPVTGETPRVGKGVTVAQVQEERTFRGRLGHAGRFSSEADENGDTSLYAVDPSRAVANAVDGMPAASTMETPEDHAMNEATRRIIGALIVQTMNGIGMPDMQRDIVARRYGIPPHVETSAREIAKQVGIQRDRVSRVLAAFQHEMTRPGGPFHAAVHTLDVGDLHAVGLGWVTRTLGPWTGPHPVAPPAVLTEPLTGTYPLEGNEGRGTAPSSPVRVKTRGVMAWFECDFHSRTFAGLYPSVQAAPRTRPCPSCGRASERVRTAAA